MGLRCCTRAFSGCGEQGLLCVGASHCGAQALDTCAYSTGPQQLRPVGSGARVQ